MSSASSKSDFGLPWSESSILERWEAKVARKKQLKRDGINVLKYKTSRNPFDWVVVIVDLTPGVGGQISMRDSIMRAYVELECRYHKNEWKNPPSEAPYEVIRLRFLKQTRAERASGVYEELAGMLYNFLQQKDSETPFFAWPLMPGDQLDVNIKTENGCPEIELLVDEYDVECF